MARRRVLVQMPAVRAVKTDIPARLDRLPWSRWHWLVVVALGTAWALNGLDVTVAAAVGPVLTEWQTLGLPGWEVGMAAAIYILGAVLGALYFGYLSEALGRKKPLVIALSVFTVGAFASALSWSFWSFALFRFITGFGIGGEYTVINAAIVELIPARVRGRSSLAINGSFWIGGMVGAAVTIPLLDPRLLPHSIGWRAALGVGLILLFALLLIRRWVPESPRWLMARGRLAQANVALGSIEQQVQRDERLRRLPRPGSSISLHPYGPLGWGDVASTLFRLYPKRFLLVFSLMAGQAFLYNSIFFTYGLVLTTFYGVSAGSVGIYLVFFALGSVLGPWTLGRLFDTVGRKPVIAATYVISGALLAATGYLFNLGILNAATQTAAWSVTFFFASAGASAAYLTASEIFPMELRTASFAVVYAMGTAIGGLAGPLLFGALIQTGSSRELSYGYLVGAGLMVAAGVVELLVGVDTERRSLESIARPLSAMDHRWVQREYGRRVA